MASDYDCNWVCMYLANFYTRWNNACNAEHCSNRLLVLYSDFYCSVYIGNTCWYYGYEKSTKNRDREDSDNCVNNNHDIHVNTFYFGLV